MSGTCAFPHDSFKGCNHFSLLWKNVILRTLVQGGRDRERERAGSSFCTQMFYIYQHSTYFCKYFRAGTNQMPSLFCCFLPCVFYSVKMTISRQVSVQNTSLFNSPLIVQSGCMVIMKIMQQFRGHSKAAAWTDPIPLPSTSGCSD